MKDCRSNCPLNLSLESIGDKWTLLIIRDIMFKGKRHFNELLNIDEGIASNILTTRLQNLEKIGVVLKTKDPNHKQKNVYTLTEAGIELLPILYEMAKWSIKYQIADDHPEKLHLINEYSRRSQLETKKKEELKKELNNIIEENDL